MRKRGRLRSRSKKAQTTQPRQLYITREDTPRLVLAGYHDEAVRKAGAEVTWLCGIRCTCAGFTPLGRDLVLVEAHPAVRAPIRN